MAKWRRCQGWQPRPKLGELTSPNHASRYQWARSDGNRTLSNHVPVNVLAKYKLFRKQTGTIFGEDVIAIGLRCGKAVHKITLYKDGRITLHHHRNRGKENIVAHLTGHETECAEIRRCVVEGVFNRRKFNASINRRIESIMCIKNTRQAIREDHMTPNHLLENEGFRRATVKKDLFVFRHPTPDEYRTGKVTCIPRLNMGRHVLINTLLSRKASRIRDAIEDYIITQTGTARGLTLKYLPTSQKILDHDVFHLPNEAKGKQHVSPFDHDVSLYVPNIHCVAGPMSEYIVDGSLVMGWSNPSDSGIYTLHLLEMKQKNKSSSVYGRNVAYRRVVKAVRQNNTWEILCIGQEIYDYESIKKWI